MIGGSGLYTLVPGGDSYDIATPYGSTSGPIVVHDIGGRPVAFLARHGEGHRYPAHRVPYRANIWALASVGVTRILAPCAVGSLRERYPRGALVVPDQIIDRTHGRDATFYDDGPVHVAFADPYCPDLRSALIAQQSPPQDSAGAAATVVVVQGPRFATAAEAAWHRQAGGDLVNMTVMPEAVLARELALCYANLAVVTDFDAGLNLHDEPVTQSAVLEQFSRSLVEMRSLLMRALAAVADRRGCSCQRALDGLTAPPHVRRSDEIMTGRPSSE